MAEFFVGSLRRIHCGLTRLRCRSNAPLRGRLVIDSDCCLSGLQAVTLLFILLKIKLGRAKFCPSIVTGDDAFHPVGAIGCEMIDETSHHQVISELSGLSSTTSGHRSGKLKLADGLGPPMD